MDLVLFKVAQSLSLMLIIAIALSTSLPLTLNKWIRKKNIYYTAIKLVMSFFSS